MKGRKGIRVSGRNSETTRLTARGWVTRWTRLAARASDKDVAGGVVAQHLTRLGQFVTGSGSQPLLDLAAAGADPDFVLYLLGTLIWTENPRGVSADGGKKFWSGALSTLKAARRYVQQLPPELDAEGNVKLRVLDEAIEDFEELAKENRRSFRVMSALQFQTLTTPVRTGPKGSGPVGRVFLRNEARIALAEHLEAETNSPQLALVAATFTAAEGTDESDEELRGRLEDQRGAWSRWRYVEIYDLFSTFMSDVFGLHKPIDRALDLLPPDELHPEDRAAFASSERNPRRLPHRGSERHKPTEIVACMTHPFLVPKEDWSERREAPAGARRRRAAVLSPLSAARAKDAMKGRKT